MADVRVEYVESDGGSNIAHRILLAEDLTITTADDSSEAPTKCDMVFVRVSSGSVYARVAKTTDTDSSSVLGMLIDTSTGVIPMKITPGWVVKLIEV